MTLVRCPGCHNMVARESVRCPVCGCKFTAAAIRYWTKWLIVILCALWLLNRWVIRRFTSSAHPQHSQVVLRVEIQSQPRGISPRVVWMSSALRASRAQ